MTTTPERQPLSLSECDDVLAYIPHALGFLPHRSAVFLLLTGRKLEATLRVDLPGERESPEHERWLGQVGELIGKLSTVESVIIVFYAEGLDAASTEAPYASLFRNTVSSLEQRELFTHRGWCIGEKWGWDYLAPAGSESFVLGDLRDNATNAALVVAGSAPLATPWDGGGISPWPQAASIRALAAAPECEDIFDSLDAWAHVLSHPASVASTLMRQDHMLCARLLGGLSVRLVRDVLPYLAGVGSDRAVNLIRQLALRREGPEVSDMADYLLGKGERYPRWEGVDRLWHLCRDLLGVAQGEHHSALLCILAWIEWARGRRSLAMTLLKSVLQESPNYRLAKLLRDMVTRGLMPQWAVDPEHAWRAVHE
ncbi:hypothetical protein GCM10027417_05350 [Glutamicibacter endophyticus]